MTLYNPGAGTKIVTGMYAGNNGDARQIVTGMPCSMVVIKQTVSGNSYGMIPNVAWNWTTGAVLAGGSALHATDGFTVYQTTDTMNATGQDYYWWAIGE